MTYEEVLANTKEVTTQYQAKLANFQQCAIVDNKAECEIIRLHMHTLLDIMLDNVYLSTRQMVEKKK